MWLVAHQASHFPLSFRHIEGASHQVFWLTERPCDSGKAHFTPLFTQHLHHVIDEFVDVTKRRRNTWPLVSHQEISHVSAIRTPHLVPHPTSCCRSALPQVSNGSYWLVAPWAFAIFNGSTLSAGLVDGALHVFGRNSSLNQSSTIIVPIDGHRCCLSHAAAVISAIFNAKKAEKASAGSTGNPSGGCL